MAPLFDSLVEGREPEARREVAAAATCRCGSDRPVAVGYDPRVKHPSLGFVWTLFALLLVAAGLLGLWVRTRPVPPRPVPQEVWQRVGVSHDMFLDLDHPATRAWVQVGDGKLPSHRSRYSYILIAPSDQLSPSELQQLVDLVTGDPLRSFKRLPIHMMFEDGAPITTATGQWQRYSARMPHYPRLEPAPPSDED